MLRGRPKVVKTVCIDKYKETYAEDNLRFNVSKWVPPSQIKQPKPRRRAVSKVSKVSVDSNDSLTDLTDDNTKLREEIVRQVKLFSQYTTLAKKQSETRAPTLSPVPAEKPKPKLKI